MPSASSRATPDHLLAVGRLEAVELGLPLRIAVVHGDDLLAADRCRLRLRVRDLGGERIDLGELLRELVAVDASSAPKQFAIAVLSSAPAVARQCRRSLSQPSCSHASWIDRRGRWRPSPLGLVAPARRREEPWRARDHVAADPAMSPLSACSSSSDPPSTASSDALCASVSASRQLRGVCELPMHVSTACDHVSALHVAAIAALRSRTASLPVPPGRRITLASSHDTTAGGALAGGGAASRRARARAARHRMRRRRPSR